MSLKGEGVRFVAISVDPETDTPRRCESTPRDSVPTRTSGYS